MASAEYQIAIKIAGNLDKSLNSAIAGAQKSLSALGMLGNAGGESLKIAAGALSAVGAGTAAVGAASVQTGREFEAAMSSAAATAGATTEEYAKLEAAAMEMGRTTSKTASESANALEYMSLAGWDVDTSIEALPSVLKAAEATGMDLAHCSDMITDSMSAAGVAVDDLSGYLDIATKAQNKSNQTAEALMEAMIGVGGTMKGLNVPIQDTSTALGVLANRGIKGSEAGNALNAVMVNLTTGAGQAGTMMKKLGISAFDAEGNFIGLEATLQAVNEATAGLTQEERNAALAAIGGKTHLDAMNALLAGLNETNAEGVVEWQALNQELWNADGALEEMRKVKLDNLNGDLATFQSSLEDTGIRIYKNLQDPLRNAVQFGTKQIYRLSDALQDGGFEGMAEAVGVVLADTLTEIASAVPKFINIASTVAQGMIRGLSDNGPALTSAVSEMLTQGIMAFADFYADFWTTGASLFAQLLEGMAARMPEITHKAVETVQRLAEGLTGQVPTILSAAAEIAVQLIDGLGEALPELTQMGATIASQLATGLADAAPTLITAALRAALQVAQGIATAAPQVVAAGLKLVEGIGHGILAGLDFLFTDGVEMVLTLADGLLSLPPGADSASRDHRDGIRRRADRRFADHRSRRNSAGGRLGSGHSKRTAGGRNGGARRHNRLGSVFDPEPPPYFTGWIRAGERTRSGNHRSTPTDRRRRIPAGDRPPVLHRTNAPANFDSRDTNGRTAGDGNRTNAPDHPSERNTAGNQPDSRSSLQPREHYPERNSDHRRTGDGTDSGNPHTHRPNPHPGRWNHRKPLPPCSCFPWPLLPSP